MKSLILASMLAAAAIVSTTAPSQAASVTVTTTERGPVRHWHKPMHRVMTHCYTKTARIHEHGHWVVRKTRVCR